MAETLHYDNKYWEGIFGTTRPKFTTEQRLHLIFSLIIFLQVSLTRFLSFMFTCKIEAVRVRTAHFMGYISTASSLEEQFAPRAILQMWYDEFPKAQEHLNDIIKPWAYRIVQDESDQLIKASSLQVKIKSLTLKDIQDLLQPETILAKYHELAPFTWQLLHTISASPNKYRKRKGKGNERTNEERLDDDDWDDDPNSADDEPEKMWSGSPSTPEGFQRNPDLVCNFFGGFKKLMKAQAILMVITMLVFVRNKATNVLPLIIGLFMKVNGTGSRAMTMLSNVGICVSGRTVERLKKRISDDAIAHAIELVTSGHLFCTIFDNINIYLRKFQQRITNQNQMIHATNSAILGIDEEGLEVSQVENLQKKLSCRGQRAQAVFGDIIPTMDDNNHIEKAFTCIIAEMLIRYTPQSNDWKGRSEMIARVHEMMPCDRPLTVKKTDCQPFGVLDVDEGSKKGLVKVLEGICERTTLKVEQWAGKTRMILGDWLTSNNLRAARRDRVDDVNSMERLEYCEELSMLWHFALQNTHMIMRTHLGNNVLDPTSLSAHKGLLGRVWDPNKPNYAAAKSLIRHSLIARLLHIAMYVVYYD